MTSSTEPTEPDHTPSQRSDQSIMTGKAVPELSWWREDAARWELLDFAGQYTEDGLPFDARWEDRQQVLEALIQDPRPGDGAFARYLLRQETSAHGHMWGFNHSIELAALLVARQRRIEDVWLLWAATCRSFDTWCGLPHRLLLAGGASATPIHVQDADHPQRENLLEHLQEMSDVTDDDVSQLLEDRLRYYCDILEDLAEE